MKNGKNIIEILDNRYSAYLEEEGKWLNEGFRNIFIEKEAKRENLKIPVYLMLPKEIRACVDQLLSGEGSLISAVS
ncbi:hypothetical protein [Sphingobacterium detergens]|uniref:Uncharacterized protein n=1 Tax=Sphingobacterium detergens TaxID=1145106 RepID=A0A420BKM1_SPHD1|nr:hypothetical protein [Sphingobacterium detergens]RKE57250.1 hypothetical protein DFQ12_2132 [Sphingobacterium detergens]